MTVPKLLLAAQLGSSEDARDAADLPGLSDVRGDRSGLAEFPEVIAAPYPGLLPFAVCGVTNLPAAGVTMREIPLLFRCRTKVLPSFALQALALSLQLAPAEIAVEPGRRVELGERLRVSIDRSGRALLDAGAFSRINRLNLDDLLLLTAGQAAPAPAVASAAARIKGGIVVLGRTDRAARVFPTPAAQQASAAEILAWAIASLKERSYVRRASPWWDVAIILACAALGWTLLRVSRRRALLVSIAALGVYALAALAAFEMAGLWLPCALPVGLAACVAGLLWLLRQDGSRAVAQAAS